MHKHKFNSKIGDNNTINFFGELSIDGVAQLKLEVSSNDDVDFSTSLNIVNVSYSQLHKLADNLKEMAFSLQKFEKDNKQQKLI